VRLDIAAGSASLPSMHRLLSGLAAALLLATPALAAPVPIAVISIEGPGVPFGTGERIDSVVARLSDEGRIDARPAELAVKKLKACGKAADRVACARARIRKRPPLALPLHLAVIAAPGPNGQIKLVCVGPRWHSPLHPPADAFLDLDAALADGPSAEAWRQRLADCLDAAASERRL